MGKTAIGDVDIEEACPLGLLTLFGKRVLDLVISLSILPILLPFMGVVALMIYADDPGPVIFRQQRTGAYNRPFTIYKFRSMIQGVADVPKTDLVGRDKIVTRIGRIIRRTSIDELPQVFNVLLGDMSLVGPRPALYNQYDLIQARTDLGIQVLKPGLTGLAQVSGRDELTLEQKVLFDYKYLKYVGVKQDLTIIVKTCFLLVRGGRAQGL